MTPNDPHDQAALDQRLQALRAELQDSLRKANSRMFTMRVVLVALILITTGYLFFVFNTLSKLDAETVTGLAYLKVQPYLDQSPQMLRDELRRRGPVWIGLAEKTLIDAPEMGGKYLRGKFNDLVTEAFDKAQPQVDETIRESIKALKTSSEKAGYNLNDKADVDRLVNDAVAQFGKHAGETVEKFRLEFNQKSEFILNGLNDLAEAKDLTPLQERHRDILISFLALTEKWKTEPPKVFADDESAPAGKPVIEVVTHARETEPAAPPAATQP